MQECEICYRRIPDKGDNATSVGLSTAKGPSAESFYARFSESHSPPNPIPLLCFLSVTTRQTRLLMRYKLGKVIVEITDSPVRIVAAVASSGAVAGLLEYFAHGFVSGKHALEFGQAVVDAVIVASAVAVIVLLVLLSTRERRRRVLDDIRKIAELNHHIRNALQVVVDSQYVPHSEWQKEAVLASVDRIDKTLRELFPVIGEREEDQAGEVCKEHHGRHLVPNRRR